MKLGWIPSGLLGLARIARHTQRIADQLTRIADALEGKAPAGQEVPESADKVVHRLPPDEELLRVDQIERHYQRVHGRYPTPEELVKELDGQEWTREDLTEDARRRLNLR